MDKIKDLIEFEGKYYARVSSVVAPFTDFDGIDKEVLNRKAMTGTQVHKTIQDEIEGNLPLPRGKIVGYFQSFEKWRVGIKPTFLESEVRYYCDKKLLTGCIDALIKLEGEEKAILVDFKTSVQESPTWIMQAHLYYYLMIQNGKQISKRFIFVKLDKDGGLPKVFQYKFEERIMDHCLRCTDKFWEDIRIL